MYDYTNVVRHLQAALIANSNCTEIVESISFNTRGKCEEIWNSQITNTWSSKDILRSIENGLSSNQETPDDTLYVDALMHEWPLPEDIPENIATNRVLNNNVFSNKLKRR